MAAGVTLWMGHHYFGAQKVRYVSPAAIRRFLTVLTLKILRIRLAKGYCVTYVLGCGGLIGRVTPWDSVGTGYTGSRPNYFKICCRYLLSQNRCHATFINVGNGADQQGAVPTEAWSMVMGRRS